jgi:hypothetical protein
VNSLPLATIYEVKIPLRKWKKSLLQRNPAQMTWANVFLFSFHCTVILHYSEYCINTFSILHHIAPLPNSLARQPCPAALPGSLAWQPCSAALPVILAEKLQA